MNKYLAILDGSTVAVVILSVLITALCFRFNLSYDINISLFSVSVIFPLVFTIREAFKRREAALKFLSLFKASMLAVHYCMSQCRKLSKEQQQEVVVRLQRVSDAFMAALNPGASATETAGSAREAENALNEVFLFIQHHPDEISGGLALKTIRFLQDVGESIENTISLTLHGTPVSMRAYCLVFVYIFPLVFAPTIVYNLPDAPGPIAYGLAALHGFVLISLYNVQVHMENPFDQVGLDDIQLTEYAFTPIPEDRLKGIKRKTKVALPDSEAPA